MTTHEKIAHRLEELQGSGYEIIDGQPDINGWDIKTRSGKKAGKVDDLLFDQDSRKVRYIIVDLDDNQLGLAEDRKVLVPIGLAELYTKSNRRERSSLDPAHNAYDPIDDGNIVYLPTVSAEQLDALPLYESGRLSRHLEVAIRKILEPVRSASNEDEFYHHEHFNDDQFYDR